MAFECIVPFLGASTFQNLHAAGLSDMDLGINENMLLLGAEFDLQPCDLLKIVHDKNNKLTRDKVMELLNAGVTSIAYISDFYRLCDLGYSMNEILILLHGSISVEKILVYDLIHLYNALGFTSNFDIQFLIVDNAQPQQILPYLQNGFSVDDYGEISKYINSEISATQASPFFDIGLKDCCAIRMCIQSGISATQAFPFFDIGLKSASVISDCLIAGVSPEQVSPYLEVGIKNHHYQYITEYVKYCISPTDAIKFNSINVRHVAYIIEYKNSGLSAEQISPFTMHDRFGDPTSIIKCIKNGLSVYDYKKNLRRRQRRRKSHYNTK